ncbi:deleted in malignant brain tumors 1 protein-like isoform X15 [Mytilus californianus]|uniref:deleted in malignant brain tumors 1 protein-like isoform X5 n=1 Tax=Mytilus californianus TaxID=6549 RepID=UPI00224756D9|nr:deleted in malignant brain tumors 1 protein-like isoform X5 [Mytilus californianus]XP_052086354.1 deleted in malignant brain tumors 1 protein-like isoform X15 [Mytilus californianus]
MNQLILLLAAMTLACQVNGQISGDLRITWTTQNNKGRLEIYHEGEWGTVCDYHFDNVDAAVACRQLGYCSGIKIPPSHVHDGEGTIWLNQLACTGSESKLLNCTYNADTSGCRHNYDVGVHCFLSCQTEDEGDLRFNSSFAVNKGRLEINYAGEWGTVCDWNFDNVDAAVACRQMGYCSGIKIPSSHVQDGEGTIWLNRLACTGSESKLLNCTYNADTSGCRHNYDVGVHCFLSCQTEDEGDLRFNSSFAVNKGRLEINYAGEWGTVCDWNFDNVDAAVACRQMGYCSGIKIPSSHVQDGEGTIWLNRLACTGSESKLLNCTYNADTSGCRHNYDVGVHCFLSCQTEDEGDLRFNSSFAVNKGRLEINYAGEWGTVCDWNFDNVDAAVACRQMGYCSGIKIPSSHVQDGEGTIWLNRLACTGSESKLLNCTYNADTSGCRHNYDVGVHCFLSCQTEDEGDLRFNSSFAVNKGRLEINYAGEWGTVCDWNFDNVDAAVACRQMGYCSGIKIPSSHVQDGEGTIWLNQLACTGSESKLLNCTYNADTSGCRHNYDVGVHCFLSCQTEDEGDLRFNSSFAVNKGRLEINYAGEWGTVCDWNFDNVDAAVACRQMGYCSGIKIPSSHVQDGEGTIWLNRLACTGSESKLLNCTYNADTSGCRHNYDVGVHCFLSCQTEDEGDLRFNSSFAVNKGRLEINYAGEWGTVCDWNFDNVDAAVACRQMGYCSGIKIPSSHVQDGEGTIWLNRLACTGSESKLLNCTYNADTSGCRHNYDVGVHCFLSCQTEDEGGLRIASDIAAN